MAEGYSTIQNVYAIRTGKVLPEYDVISLLLKSLGDYLRFRIEKAVKVATKDKFAAGKEDQNTEKSPVE